MSTRTVILEGGAPWGFRMHGGADTHQPLRISRVNPGSKAALKGVREGDLITSINGQPTKDATNSASHALLKSAGDILKLGLNEDPSGSPKRRQYKTNTIKKETISSETIQRSNISTTTFERSQYSVKDDDLPPEDELDQSAETSINHTNAKPNDETKHPVKDGVASQRSTLSSNCSSSASTPSQLSDLKVIVDRCKNRNHSRPRFETIATTSASTATVIVDTSAIIGPLSVERQYNNAMPDNSNESTVVPREANSRSRRRRRKKLATKQNNNNHDVAPEVLETTLEAVPQKPVIVPYRVDSPKTVKIVETNPKTNGCVVKSKSFDNDDVRIVELSETSDIEDAKGQISESTAIIVEANSDVEWENTEELKDTTANQQIASLSTLTLSIEQAPFVVESSISPEDEQNLRTFLEGINLVTQPDYPIDNPEASTSNTADSIRQKRQKKREELVDYFGPAFQNSHYLDVISEEGSDLSDREASMRKSLTLPSKSGSVSSVPMLSEVCISQLQEPSSSVEVVLLHDSDSNSDYDEVDEPIYENVCNITDSAKEGSTNEEVECDDNSKIVPISQNVDMVLSVEYTELSEEDDKQMDNNLSTITKNSPTENNSNDCNDLTAVEEFLNRTINNDSIIDSKEKDQLEGLWAENIVESLGSNITADEAIALNELRDETLLRDDNLGSETEILASLEAEESVQSNKSTNDADVKCKIVDVQEKINKLDVDSGLDYLKTIDESFQKEFREMLREVDLQKSYTRSRKSSSESSASDSIGTTAKLNPLRNSIGNVASILIDEELAYKLAMLEQPKSLKDVCLKLLLSLPFGSEILAELAEVSNSLQYLTDHLKPTPINYDNWQKLLVSENSNTVLCISPTQKEYLDTCKVLPNEATQLLDLHSKYINRTISEPSKNCDKDDDNSISNVTVIIQNQRKAGPDKNLAIDQDKNHLLSIVQNETNIIPHYSSNNRLQARDLNEWLTLARNSCNTDPPKNSTMSYKHQQQRCASAPPRRRSLPHELFVGQMQRLIEQEKHVQLELERLEAEKRHLTAAIMHHKEFDVDQYKISKQGDIAILEDEFDQANMAADSENFRQRMYDEYLDKMAARAARKQQKIIKLTAPDDSSNKMASAGGPDVTQVTKLEVEFMAKVREKMDKRGLVPEEIEPAENNTLCANTIVVTDSDDCDSTVLPRHLQEFVDITRLASSSEDDTTEDDFRNAQRISKALSRNRHKSNLSLLHEIDENLDLSKGFLLSRGIWSPGQQHPHHQSQDSEVLQRQLSQLSQDSSSTIREDELGAAASAAVAQVWTPRSAGSSPTVERKEFRPVNFESPKPARRTLTKQETLSDTEPSCPRPNASAVPSSNQTDKRLPTSHSAPGPDFSSTGSGSSKLPRAQNPTITLLQKAREGQLPRGAAYIEERTTSDFRSRSDRNLTDGRLFYGPREGAYQVRSDYTSESESERPRRMVDIRPRNYDGIGPTTKDGMPTVLRSEIRDTNQAKWYKKMYDTIHKQKPRYDDEYVTIRYKQRRGRYPYNTSGYLSEPEPGAYDSDAALSDYNRYATLDRRRASNKENEYSTTMSYTMPRNTTSSISYLPNDVVNQSRSLYRNQPGRIENYMPGRSSVSDKEAKQWWDEVMDIFDGHLEQQKRVPQFQPRGYMSQALKESGYESDSTLVFRRREDALNQQLSPTEQKEVYKNIQKGGEVPLHGLRKPLPERPKDDALEYYTMSPNHSRIRVHNMPKINNVFTCYPVQIQPVFGTFKRTAPSKVDSPPSPPKRYSSRNNTTLRYFSQRKAPIRSEHTRRHESCFSPPNSQQVSPKIKPREKTPTPTLGLMKSKSESGLLKESTLSRPARPLKKVETTTKRSRSNLSLDKTFGTEKRKVELLLKTPEKKRIVRSPDLTSPKEVKKANIQSTSLAGQSKLKRGLISGSKEKLGSTDKKVVRSKKVIDKISTASKLFSPALVSKSTSVSMDSVRTKPKTVKALVSKSRKPKTEFEVFVKDKPVTEPLMHQSMIPAHQIIQNLQLTQSCPSPTSSLNSSISFKIDSLQRRISYVEPSIGALKVYLNATKPVTDSKFKTLDRAVRSRSASPKGYSWSYDCMYNRRSVSSPPKLIFSQTSRPLTPIIARRAMTEFKVVEKYSRPMYFSDTVRPISPVVTRRNPKPASVDRTQSSSPSMLYFTETSRPVSPVVQHKTPSVEELLFYPIAHKPPEKMIFSDTSRPISPYLDRKVVRSPSSRKIQAKSLRKPEYRSKSLESDTRSQFETMYFGPNSLNYSNSSIDSCGTDYQQYIQELRSNSRRSDRFKDLNRFYSDLERLGQLEKVTSSLELRPRLTTEHEIIDYDRWQVVRQREKAEREISHLYKQLNEYQQEKDLLFRPKKIEAYRWKKDFDRGLNIKEKSVEDIKETLKQIVEKNRLKESRWKKELEYRRQIYKPLWRGNSVVSLAQILNDRRSLSEGRQPIVTSKLMACDEKLLTHGVGSRIWSSLSMDQVNVLKNQLSEIYGNDDAARKPPKEPNNNIIVAQQNYNIDVNVKQKETKPSTLFVRRNSDREIVLTESEKRRLSQSLSKEVLERQKQKYHSSVSLMLGKETRGAILTSNVTKSVSELPSPRTCYSLEMSEDGKEEKTKDNDFVLVLAKDDSSVHKNNINETMEVWAQPKKALVTTNAINTNTSKQNSETDSTDGSTKTVICTNNIKEKVLEKVEFFEREKEVYTPTIHRPADPLELEEVPAEEFHQKPLSNSQQDLKELFGEKLHLYTMQPLSASRKTKYVPPTKPKTLPKQAAADTAIYRSRSLSPYPDDSYGNQRHGEVHKLTEKFETLEDFYSHRTVRPRRSLSDPTLNATVNEIVGNVDTLRKKYEYPNVAGRGRSRTRRGGIVSPMVLRAEDRFMPHINVISKIARLYRQKPQYIKDRSNEELAKYLGIPVGEVEKLRQKFDTGNGISLLGHMFTSSPNLDELQNISQYLTGGWTAHRYPRREDNARSLSNPDNNISGPDVIVRRKDKLRSKSASPIPRQKPTSSILKKQRNNEKNIVKPKARYQQQYVKSYISTWPNISSYYRPSVSFKEPEAPTPPPKGHYTLTLSDSESPRKYVENDVTIHYKSPIRQEVKEALSEDELSRRQAESMTKLYQEERRRKYLQVSERSGEAVDVGSDVTSVPPIALGAVISATLATDEERQRNYLQVSERSGDVVDVGSDVASEAIALGAVISATLATDELKDMNSRRHTDHFTAAQKSPISLNRYDDFIADQAPRVKSRPRSPEPRLVARALYNFVGQSGRELTFRKGDVIYIRRQVDKNWYEGEHNAAMGLFPANYVQIVPFDGITSTHRKPTEGQARARYNFIAQTHLELSLAKGELVVITRRVDDNWYEGKIGGRKGIFPVSYVEVVIEPNVEGAVAGVGGLASKPVASPAAHSMLLNGSAGGKESMGSHTYIPSLPASQDLVASYRAKPVQLSGTGTYGSLKKNPVDQTLHIDTASEPIPYKALYKYRPQNDDELELLEGDTVYVLEKCDDGWFVGSSNRTGAFGTFPGNYVERI